MPSQARDGTYESHFIPFVYRYLYESSLLLTTIQHLARARSVALRLGLVCCLRRRLSTSLVVYSSGLTCLRYNFLDSYYPQYIYTTKYYLLTSSTLSLRRRYVVFHTADSRLLYIEHIRYNPITTLRTANHR